MPTLDKPLYEDEWLLALHKPDSIPVHPTGIFYFSSMVMLARETFNNPELTPLHRLDLETDGVLLFAKQKGYIRPFHQLFESHAVQKSYSALVHGKFPDQTKEISGWIAPCTDSLIHTKLWLYPKGRGPKSITRIKAAGKRGRFSELQLEPVTGKTNQLRVHLAATGHHIVGDKKYDPDESIFLNWLAHRDFQRLQSTLVLPRQALQCTSMGFDHPFSKAPLTIQTRPETWVKKTEAAFQ